MNTNPKQSAKPPQKSPHLDEFPDEADQIAWERAVLERARAAGLLTSGQINTKEDLFWQKLRAYEAREISKRRQSYKQSRLERFDELAELRVERGIRHGLVDDAAMKCETKMQRRAERFGIKCHTGADGVLSGGVLEWMTDEQRLKMRRARFEKEPRDDSYYRKEWVSESGGEKGIMDEQRMAERRRRFFGESKGQKSLKVKDTDKLKVEKSEKLGQGSNELQNFQINDPFKRSDVNTEARESMDVESDGQVLQEWEKTCESWGAPSRQNRDETIQNKDASGRVENKAESGRDMDIEVDGNVLQEWERTCESWGAQGHDVDGQRVPDAVQVNEVRRVTKDARNMGMELTRENLLSMTARDESAGKVLQSWEAGGEEW